MGTRVVALLAVGCLLMPASKTWSQDETLEVRLVRVAGLGPEVASAFFDALRKNAGRDDRRAACAMVAYPLQHASGVVKDASDCEARYDAIFTVAVRKAIGRQQFDDVFVSQAGVMIGIGELWFAGRCAAPPCQALTDLHITAINSRTEGLQPPKGKVLLACVVSGQRIRVSADGSGGASLSVWIAPRFSGAPEREFPKAEPAGPPSECGSRTWRFSDPARTYTISELPCDAYLSPPPMGSVGRVALSTPASPGTPLWCLD